MSEPRFSVVVPLYNHARFVGAAIESVLGQSFGDFELIVCNDGSTDDSLEVVRRYQDPRMRLIDKPNGGTVSALNACLLAAKGTYVCWLSSDDLFSPDKLLVHQRHHAAHPASSLSIAPFGYLKGTEWIPAAQLRVPSDFRLVQFAYGNYVNGLSVCASRRMYAQYGLFDQRYLYAHDVERWFAFFRHEVPVFLDGPAQSHTRLESGHIADGDLLGQLDVLKFLCRVVQGQGLRGFLPAEAATAPGPAPLLAALLARLLDANTLFHRFHMRRYLIEWLAQGPGAEDRRRDLPAAIELCARQPGMQDEILRALGELNGLLQQSDPLPTPSFAEHMAQLKAGVESPDHRRVLQRFLRVGF